MDIAREFLRHTVATVAYRGEKSVRNAPESFAEFQIGENSRTPAQILAHIGDLFDWALWMAKGEHRWQNSAPLTWDNEVQRFFETLQRFDEYLASDQPIQTSPEKLFQGPIADALQHIGQINYLRRLADAPIRGENYFKAEIKIGKVGSEQSLKRIEFD
ncbi:MAG TPA: hypothetical protein PKY82_20090 [Pyrinomonadaceae bacterium]|nr:hypothetical protein [Pyrinomonadaceae bacterium]